MDTPNSALHTYVPVTRNILRLGTPLLFGQITHYLHQIADSAMLGHYGEQSLELGAMGIAGLVTWMLMTFLWPLSSGVQALASRRFGRQRMVDVEGRSHTEQSGLTGEVLDNGLLVVLWAGILALGVSYLAGPVLGLLLNSPDILRLTMDYVGIMRLSLIPMGIFVVAQGFLGAINRTKPVMYAGIISNVLNIFLNWIFIFGNFGFPAMGIRGAALGTLISTIISALFLLSVLFFHGYRQEYRLFTFRKVLPGLQLDMVRVALPPAIQNITALGIFLIFQTMIESYGALYLAATHSIFAYMRLNKTIIGGFARAASILVGNALGTHNRPLARQHMAASGMVGLSIALGVGVFTLVFRNWVAWLFTSDPATRELLEFGLVFFLGFYFVEALGYAFEMVFVGNGYGKYVLFSEFSTNVVFILGATMLARRFFPDQVVWAWLAFGTYQVFHALFMIVGFFRGTWLHVKVETRE